MCVQSLVNVAMLLAAVQSAPAREQHGPSWSDSSPHRVRLVGVDENVQLEVLDWGGSGRPIVLLAGLGNTAHVFDEFASKLTSHGHIYGITRRGYGASTLAESGYDVDRLGKDVLAVLDHLSIRKPVLIGHSIAGQELSFIASQHADRVAGLVYLDAAYRYAYHRPGVRENLRELQKKLELLDAELGKPPRSPAELSTAIRTTLGETLVEFQKDLNELMTTPEFPGGAPPPEPSDLADFAAYRAWSARVHGYALPEAELRQVRRTTSTGGVGPIKTHAAASKAIGAGSQRFTEIRLPTLAIFASPHGLGPWTNKYPEHRTAFDAFSRFDQAMTERQAAAFERGVEAARVIRFPNAGHYLFITQENEVLREVVAFVVAVGEASR